MKAKVPSLALAAVALLLPGCQSRTDKTDGGGVLLSITGPATVPFGVSVSRALQPTPENGVGGGFVTISDLTITSVVKDPTGATSALMDVEIHSYEVTFARADSGSREPPGLVRGFFASVPVGGTANIENLPILTANQLAQPPLRDLVDQGADGETGSEVIVIDLTLRFFGRTLSGKAVETAPANFTIDFTQ